MQHRDRGALSLGGRGGGDAEAEPPISSSGGRRGVFAVGLVSAVDSDDLEHEGFRRDQLGLDRSLLPRDERERAAGDCFSWRCCRQGRRRRRRRGQRSRSNNDFVEPAEHLRDRRALLLLLLEKLQLLKQLPLLLELLPLLPQ